MQVLTSNPSSVISSSVQETRQLSERLTYSIMSSSSDSAGIIIEPTVLSNEFWSRSAAGRREEYIRNVRYYAAALRGNHLSQPADGIYIRADLAEMLNFEGIRPSESISRSLAGQSSEDELSIVALPPPFYFLIFLRLRFSTRNNRETKRHNCNSTTETFMRI